MDNNLEKICCNNKCVTWLNYDYNQQQKLIIEKR